MLIKCPECRKEVSDKAKACIHCGYPLEDLIQVKDETTLSTEICPLCKGNSHILKGIEDTCSVCGYVFNREECKRINPDWGKVEDENISNHPKCPTCGSTNIKQISTTSRLVSTSLFGLSSGKIGKQWHCRNCNSNF